MRTTLTDRQRDVVIKVAEGKSNKMAAAELEISEGSFEKHIGKARRNLGCCPQLNPRALLTRYAVEKGLVASMFSLLLFAGCVTNPSEVITPSNPIRHDIMVPPLPQISTMTARAIVAPQSYLTWDKQTNITQYAVYTGPSRTNLPYRTVVSTNYVVYVPTNYAVTALNGTEESMPAFWPSNRIAELWLIGYNTNDFSQKTNLSKLLSFTNDLPANMQFWGVENRTVGFE